MSWAISVIVRNLIVSARQSGMKIKDAAKTFKVSIPTVCNIMRRHKETGSVEPIKPKNGRKSVLSQEQIEQIRETIKQQPDITLQELKDSLSLPICISGLCRILRNKLGFSLKKTLHSFEQTREDVEQRREEWKEKQLNFDFEKLIFIDESSINVGMTRLYGRALNGERVIDYVPNVRFKRISIVSSVRANGEIVPMVFKGTLTGELFTEYVSQCLAPTLRPGDIVVMDNLSSHKVKGVREAIENTGARVEYLPPYSPDMNPIEQMWSKAKAGLRKLKAKTEEMLEESISKVLSWVSTDDIFGWFVHSGYNT